MEGVLVGSVEAAVCHVARGRRVEQTAAGHVAATAHTPSHSATLARRRRIHCKHAKPSTTRRKNTCRSPLFQSSQQ